MLVALALQYFCPALITLAPTVEAASSQYEIDPVVLVALFARESACDPKAVNSRTGAIGLGQILPDGSAARGLTVGQLKNVETNITTTARHIAKCLLLCGSMVRALAVYHGRQYCRSDAYARGILRRVADFRRWLLAPVVS